MPDFKPEEFSGATSEELTAALLEPEAALEAEQTVSEAATSDNALDFPLPDALHFEPEAEGEKEAEDSEDTEPA